MTVFIGSILVQIRARNAYRKQTDKVNEYSLVVVSEIRMEFLVYKNLIILKRYVYAKYNKKQGRPKMG